MTELYVAAIVAMTVVVVAWMITRTVSEYYRAKAMKARQMSMVRRSRTSGTQEQRELGPWVKELLEQLGHDEEELYQDEMPDELQELLKSPLVKSFIGNLGQKGAAGEQQEGPGGWL